jgi:alkanesulfonate monooxygenase SsuD/methylene tetrahydromethanopterin reductase-like flavin-dependent oxidoreductase (luciferase family)
MQIALFNIMALNHEGETPASVMAATKAAVARADALGFDVAWFAEHHFSAFSVCASPQMMAMHCAGFTSRIKLGPGVLVLPLHEPLRMIEELGMLDHASGGRLVVGIGAGHQPHEFRSLGVSMDERHDRMMESWDLMNLAWRDGHLAHDGKFAQIPPTHFAMGPVGGRRPEMFVATHDPRVVARAAREGAVVFISPGPRATTEALAQRDFVWRAAAEAGVAPADVKLGVQRYVFVTESPVAARAACEGMVHFMRRMRSLRDPYPARDGLHLHSIPFPGEPDVDWLLENAMVGDADTVADRLAHDVAALRPHHLSVYMGFSGLPGAELEHSVTLFGERVVPRLRAMEAQREDMAVSLLDDRRDH